MPLTGFDIDLCAAAALPGAGRLEYVPIDEVDLTEWDDSIEPGAWNQQKAVFAATWYALPYAAGSGAWTEEQQDSPQGDYFRISVSARIPSDLPAVRGELNRMKQHRYLLRLTRDGRVLLLGTPEQPLRFSARFSSGADGGDTRAHNVTFTGASLRKSPGYVPAF